MYFCSYSIRYRIRTVYAPLRPPVKCSVTSTMPSIFVVSIKSDRTVGPMLGRYLLVWQVLCSAFKVISGCNKQNLAKNASILISFIIHLLWSKLREEMQIHFESWEIKRWQSDIGDQLIYQCQRCCLIHRRELWFIGLQIDPLPMGIIHEEEIAPDVLDSCNQSVDHFPFVVHNFSAAGYYSTMIEDWAQGAFTWPLCRGFSSNPFTHNMKYSVLNGKHLFLCLVLVYFPAL